MDNPEANQPLCRFGECRKKITVDVDIFARNKCSLPGSVIFDPSVYPEHYKGKGSFGYLIQRMSDRNYAMRALCIDGHGAEYSMFQLKGFARPSIAWHPSTNLDDHACNRTIIDGCHLNLIHPFNGQSRLDGSTIVDTVAKSGENIECLFLNGGSKSNSSAPISANDLAKAISKCSSSLLCVSLIACDINTNLLDALASCSKLRGLIFDDCHIECGQMNCVDVAFASVFTKCPLLWCFVQTNTMFGFNCWNALAAEGSCPNLKVLWVDNSKLLVKTDSDTIRRALKCRADTLKLRMICPGKKYISMY